jgi:hypothetical protein
VTGADVLALDDLAQRIEGMTNTVVKVGVFSGHAYPDGTSLAEVVITQEFGDPALKIPSRPFMRPALHDSEKAMASEAIKQLREGKEADQIGKFLGAYLVGQMRKKIAQIHTPKLRPLTLENRLARGVTSIKPLIDSGYMQASLNFTVGVNDD